MGLFLIMLCPRTILMSFGTFPMLLVLSVLWVLDGSGNSDAHLPQLKQEHVTKGCRGWAAKAKLNQKVANDNKAVYKTDSTLWGTTQFASLWHPIGHPVSAISFTLGQYPQLLPSIMIQPLPLIFYTLEKHGKQCVPACQSFKASAHLLQKH